MSNGVLVAGIGNVFMSDDAFGVEVISRLSGRVFPPGVRVKDYGIRGVHLAYDLLDGYDALVLVDAVAMNEPPGTVVVIHPDVDGSIEGDVEAVMDAHSMSPEVVLATLGRLGGTVAQIFVVGCQPALLDDGMGLSRSVADAVDPAAELCVQLVTEILQSVGKETNT